ncbi:MAG: ribonuclease HI family protein [Thermomicrobium sp.]|nr:ribonuclease HI family protein [Thermomicrobium sp.]
MHTTTTMTATVVFDGGSRGNPGPAYGSFRLDLGDGLAEVQRIEFAEPLTNNQAEYRTLIAALEALLELLERRGIRPDAVTVELQTDSELVVRQLRGAYKVRNPNLRDLHERARRLLDHFGRWDIAWQPRAVIYRYFGH